MGETKTTTTQILVTLDGSARDTTAIGEAARLAAGLQAQVTLLRVIRPPRGGYPETPGDLLAAVDRAELAADEELRTYQMAFDRTVTRAVLVGRHPAGEIIGWLRAHPADFVVMVTRGKTFWSRLFGGSVTEAVRRSGLAPVVAIRDGYPDRTARPVTAAGPAQVAGAAST